MVECESHEDIYHSKLTGVYYVREAKDMAHVINGQYHRLDGPAVYVRNLEDYSYDAPDEYYINGVMYEYNEYWNHPLVFTNKVEAILAFDV